MTVIRDLLTSKKFLAMLAGIIVWAAGFVGLDLQLEAVLPPLGMIAAYILAQGWADHGKEAEKLKAKSLTGKGQSGP